MGKMCSLIFLFLSAISHKKCRKGEFETYQHICNFSDKICPLHHHCHIKSGLKCFLGSKSSQKLHQFQSNITPQYAGNNCNDKANTDTSDTETCLCLESEWNKAKLDRWNDQQIQVIRVSKVLKSSKHHNIWV